MGESIREKNIRTCLDSIRSRNISGLDIDRVENHARRYAYPDEILTIIENYLESRGDWNSLNLTMSKIDKGGIIHLEDFGLN